MNNTVAVIIPTYHPGKEFAELLRRLEQQSTVPSRILVMNTDPAGWREDWEQQFPLVEVHHLTREEFDHGGTRRRAAALCTEDALLFMTQDAIPADRHLIERMCKALKKEGVGAVYARQLPKPDCRELERLTREFNYPARSHVRYQRDTKAYGIKTYFCSNVCAMYERAVYESVGGFPERTIFNEDMIYAGRMVQKGYGVAYAADARVYHSHNYTGLQQFHRNFDLGVSQAEFPEIFAAVPSEGEGLRMIRHTARELLRRRRPALLGELVWMSGWKYLGYRLGKRYRRLPMALVKRISMSPAYWGKGKTQES